MREAIFYACAGAQCPILMMRSTGVSLRSIFLELTNDKSGSDESDSIAQAAPRD